MDLVDVSIESDHQHDLPSGIVVDGGEKVEPGALLEESWFFGSLLDRKTRMSRCFSDPCPSSSNRSQEMLVEKSFEETYSSINRFPVADDACKSKTTRPSLSRTPSLPPFRPLSREDPPPREGKKFHDPKRNKLTLQRPGNNLIRAPSLPPCIVKEEEPDEESDFSMGKLIRQASLREKKLPPRHNTKIMTQTSSIPRQRPRRKEEIQGTKGERSQETKRGNVTNNHRLKSCKSLSDLEIEEVQGFKDLGFKFDKMDLNQNVVSILPGLQEKKPVHDEAAAAAEEDKTRRPYLSEAWKVQRQLGSGPGIPDWVGKKSTEDMKSQIKFWARAVASNVRQEC